MAEAAVEAVVVWAADEGLGNWNGTQCFAVCAYVSKGIVFV